MRLTNDVFVKDLERSIVLDLGYLGVVAALQARTVNSRKLSPLLEQQLFLSALQIVFIDSLCFCRTSTLRVCLSEACSVPYRDRSCLPKFSDNYYNNV